MCRFWGENPAERPLAEWSDRLLTVEEILVMVQDAEKPFHHVWNSEPWQPERIAATLLAMTNALRATECRADEALRACRATLMFHSGEPWDAERSQK